MFSVKVVVDSPGEISVEDTDRHQDILKKEISIEGRPEKITIVKEGKPQFSFVIYENGDVLIHDYVGSGFSINMPHNLYLENSRQWRRDAP